MTTIATDNARRIDSQGTMPLRIRLSESFENVVRLNPDLCIEQSADGELILMSPTGGESGYRNGKIGLQLGLWAQSYGGYVFDSSTLFQLPNGAKRSPDAAWISEKRWLSLTVEERKGFPPISPNFVIELRSDSDRLVDLQAKMQEYMDTGVRLGWLIDPFQRHVHVYQPNESHETKSSDSISNQTCLPGFVLDLSPIWAQD